MTDNERAGVALHFIRAEVSDTAHGGFAPGERRLLGSPETANVWDAEVAKTLHAPVLGK
jgi:hypothetical protein